MKYLTQILPDDKLARLLNLEDSEGRTCARIAAWEGNLKFLELISNLSLLDKADFENRTPLFAACYMQHTDIGMSYIL
jgi:ankyrin repeat protein